MKVYTHKWRPTNQKMCCGLFTAASAIIKDTTGTACQNCYTFSFQETCWATTQIYVISMKESLTIQSVCLNAINSYLFKNADWDLCTYIEIRGIVDPIINHHFLTLKLFQKTAFIRMLEIKQLLVANTLQNIFFCIQQKFIQDWNNFRMRKWWQNVIFGWTIPLNGCESEVDYVHWGA